ncbi:MAG: hypothetical protein AAFQ98_20140 [Bacteroidota bacterium]
MANNATSIHARYWDATQPDFVFPEQSDSVFGYGPVKERPSTGICFSGGGTVSAALIAGYLQGLEELGLTDQLGYISGVSGGSWGSTPYTFLPEKLSDEEFLGPKHEPSELRGWRLRWRKRGSLVRAVTKAQIANKTVLNAIFRNEAFSRAVGEIFLRPFGIDSPPKLGKQKRYFASTPEVLNDILTRNTLLEKGDFVLMRKDRPFLIINGVVYVPKGEEESKQGGDFHELPFEFTPLYCGSSVRYPFPGKDGQIIGGSYIESMGFDAELESVEDEAIVRVKSETPFSICDPMGTSGAVVAKLLVEYKSGLKLLFPQYRYSNPIHPEGGTKTYEFGDAGLLENLGIIPLLVRQVKSIVLFSTAPFDIHHPTLKVDISERAERLFGFNQIAALFGAPVYDLDPRSETYLKRIKDPRPLQVFPEEDFASVEKALQDSKKSGGPVSFSGTLRVLENGFLGVKGGWECQVMFLCVDKCTRWEEQLPRALKRRIGRLGFTLRTFPIIRVFVQNPPYVIQLTRTQANLLGNLGYWMVKEKAAILRKMMKGSPGDHNK